LFILLRAYFLILPNVLLIIEEPEANVHPEAQIRLMELFLELAFSGEEKVKLIITTHSDTILDRLNNSIISRETHEDNLQIQHLVLGPKGSYDAGDMMPTKNGIEDNNFVEAMNSLFNERAEAFRSLEEGKE
jgi:predicted ATPase